MKRSGKKEKHEMREDKVVIDGVIIADDWDDNGRVTDLSLLTTNDEKYYIENGEMMMKLIRKYVSASGVVRDHKNGEKSINIKKCTVLEEALDDDFDQQFNAVA